MLFWIIATLSAFFVKGLCGFANTLVLTRIEQETRNCAFGLTNMILWFVRDVPDRICKQKEKLKI